MIKILKNIQAQCNLRIIFNDDKNDFYGEPKEIKKDKRKPISQKLRTRIYARDNCACKICGKSPNNNPDCVLTIDHIIPVCKDGNNDESNLQTLCRSCNSKKGIKDQL